MRLLFCSCSPLGTPPITAIEELRGVLLNLDAHEWHVNPIGQVDLRTFRETIRDFRPDIVHFCGHSGRDFVGFVNPHDQTMARVSPRAFGEALRAGRKPLNALILNSCASFELFSHLRDTASHGVGSLDVVTNNDCVNFVREFYQHLNNDPRNVIEAWGYAFRSMANEPRSGDFFVTKMEPRSRFSMFLAGLTGLFMITTIASYTSYMAAYNKITIFSEQTDRFDGERRASVAALEKVNEVLAAQGIRIAELEKASTKAAAPVPERIVTAHFVFNTNGDDKEGGLVDVELLSGGRVVWNSLIQEEQWADPSIKIFDRNIDMLVPEDPLATKVRLTDGREVNIRWSGVAELSFLTSRGRNIRFAGGFTLDTTGRGRPRSAETPIPRVD